MSFARRRLDHTAPAALAAIIAAIIAATGATLAPSAAWAAPGSVVRAYDPETLRVRTHDVPSDPAIGLARGGTVGNGGNGFTLEFRSYFWLALRALPEKLQQQLHANAKLPVSRLLESVSVSAFETLPEDCQTSTPVAGPVNEPSAEVIKPLVRCARRSDGADAERWILLQPRWRALDSRAKARAAIETHLAILLREGPVRTVLREALLARATTNEPFNETRVSLNSSTCAAGQPLAPAALREVARDFERHLLDSLRMTYYIASSDPEATTRVISLVQRYARENPGQKLWPDYLEIVNHPLQVAGDPEPKSARNLRLADGKLLVQLYACDYLNLSELGKLMLPYHELAPGLERSDRSYQSTMGMADLLLGTGKSARSN